MNEIYQVIKVGVYIQAVSSIYYDINKAKEAAIALAENDDDSYHEWILIQIDSNTLNIFEFDGTENLNNRDDLIIIDIFKKKDKTTKSKTTA